MRPGSVKDATSGGHWFLSEFKAATFDVSNIEPFGNEFFDMSVKHVRGNSPKFKTQTCFPAINTIEDCVDTIIDAIDNSRNVKNISESSKNIAQQAFQFSNQSNQEFVIRIESFKASFYPISPLDWK